ncbi:unnamed protein product [Thlaspi arvense]|uniref:Uncharacterized protein n=1 Tax=Thlaspi arvense TaxID=13288 RepID=A0AAU9RS20_THLAR|nr:unnamed protein product [Thlaspi arvense]
MDILRHQGKMQKWPKGRESKTNNVYFLVLLVALRHQSKIQKWPKGRELSGSLKIGRESSKTNNVAVNKLVETAPNVKRDAAATSQVPKEAANTNVRRSLKFVEKNSSKAGLSKALGKQKVQASQKPVPPCNETTIELWKQILSTLGEIGSTREQMLKLMTDGQCFGSRPSAAGSSKRQRAEKEQERGDNEEAEKLQEQERGDNEEAEKLQEQERGDNEEAEKLQEQERGDNEEAANKKVQERGDKEEAEKLQEQERGDNEKAAKLQEKERGDNEEAANQKEKERGDTEEAEKLQEKVRGDKEEAANEKEQERGDNEEAAKLLDLNQPSPQ